MLAIEPFRSGRRYHLNVPWIIENLDSIDGLESICYDVQYCEFIDYDSIPDEDDPVARDRWINDVYEVTGRERWEHVLHHKRGDEQYEDVVRSLSEYGMVRPATLDVLGDGSIRRFGDGHHRLAAHVDLGWETILVCATDEGIMDLVSMDSGSESAWDWDLHIDGVPIRDLMYPDEQ